MDFFTRSSANLAAAAEQAGLGHYVALSIVGVDGLPESGYMRAKVVQEKAIAESGLPYTIVRATQFQEFAAAIVGSLDVGDEVRAPDALIQPIAADDVAAEVTRVAAGSPRDGVVNIGGPDKIRSPTSPAACWPSRAATRRSLSTCKPLTSARGSPRRAWSPATMPCWARSASIDFN
jgi:uncharacterized protein YbjT (DUF2867 family)